MIEKHRNFIEVPENNAEEGESSKECQKSRKRKLCDDSNTSIQPTIKDAFKIPSKKKINLNKEDTVDNEAVNTVEHSVEHDFLIEDFRPEELVEVILSDSADSDLEAVSKKAKPIDSNSDGGESEQEKC